MDDRAEFEARKRVKAQSLGGDRALFEQALEALQAADSYDYTYLWSWMGVPIIQLPADVMATQEVIWATRPDVIIETGVARGGSVLFMASMPHRSGIHRRVSAPRNRSKMLFKGDEPLSALNVYLKETDRFEGDPVLNGKLIFASSPCGYLDV